MKKLIAAMAASLHLAGNCAWIDATGNPIPDTPSMRSDGDFGVQVVLTPSEKEFRKTWNATAATPRLTSTSTAKVGSFISAVLVFTGCDGGSTNLCNVSTEFLLQAPDGRVATAGEGPVWTSAPPKPGTLMLGQASVSIGFDDTDALGTYQVIANVTDKVANKTLSLRAPVILSK